MVVSYTATTKPLYFIESDTIKQEVVIESTETDEYRETTKRIFKFLGLVFLGSILIGFATLYLAVKYFF
jgi:hypothetical protein